MQIMELKNTITEIKNSLGKLSRKNVRRKSQWTWRETNKIYPIWITENKKNWEQTEPQGPVGQY